MREEIFILLKIFRPRCLRRRKICKPDKTGAPVLSAQQ